MDTATIILHILFILILGTSIFGFFYMQIAHRRLLDDFILYKKAVNKESACAQRYIHSLKQKNLHKTEVIKKMKGNRF